MKGLYIVGGYPDMETFENCFKIIEKLNFDFVEIGIPFSEPVADGVTIAEAIEHSVRNNVSTETILNFLKKKQHSKIKKYVMTYANIVYGYGLKKFSEDFKGLVNSIIIADLPNKMHEFFYNKGFDIPIIPFVTPESRDTDIEMIKKLKGDFVYFIAIRGITGGNVNLNNKHLIERISAIKERTGKKVIMGFGLKTKEDARISLKVADGYVIGTEAVKRQNKLKEFENFFLTFNN